MGYSVATYIIVVATFIGMFLSGVISYLYSRLGWNYGLIAVASAYISFNNFLAFVLYTQAILSPGGPSAPVEFTPFMRVLEWGGVLVVNGTSITGFLWAYRFYSLVHLKYRATALQTNKKRTYAAVAIPLALTLVAILVDLYAPPETSYLPFSVIKDLGLVTIPFTLYMLVATSLSIFNKQQEIQALLQTGDLAISLGVFYRSLILFMTFGCVTFAYFGTRVNNIYLKPGVVYTDAYKSYTNDSLAWKNVLSSAQAFVNIFVFGTAKVLYEQRKDVAGGRFKTQKSLSDAKFAEV